MTTRAEDQAAEIARLTEALVARTEELAESMAALTVMRARYEHLEDEAEVLAAIARAAIPVVTQPLTDEMIGTLLATLKAYETWEATHPAPATEIVVIEVPAGIERRHGVSSLHKKTTVPKPVAV